MMALSSTAQNATYLLQQGIQAYRAGQFEQAFRLFDQAVQIQPKSSEAYLYRGNTNFILRRYSAAESDYTSALENSYRARPESIAGTYRAEGVTILEPNPAARDQEVYALLYNNRGAARYLQGKRTEALRDFDLSLDFSPTLDMARENRQLIVTGQIVAQGGSTTPGQGLGPTRGASLGRPIDPITWDNVDDLTKQANRTRDYRENGRISGFSGLFQPRPFEKRSIPRRGKTYKLPNVAAVSQEYLQILEVMITERETIVTVSAKNLEGKSYYTRIFPPGQPESYVLVDRTPDGRAGFRYELIQVQGISTEAAGTLIQPDEELIFTLTFRKIDDRIGYVNLVEGNLQTSSAWNFYQIDLTR